MKNLIIITTVFIVAVTSSIYVGIHIGRNQMVVELLDNQTITLKVQRDLKLSLHNQVQYIQDLNDAHEKSLELPRPKKMMIESINRRPEK